MQQALGQKERRERLKRVKADEEMAECSFRPNINRKMTAPSIININKLEAERVPLHERATDIQKSK